MRGSRDFVYKKFGEFYRNPSTDIPAPVAINQREFGFLLFRERAMVRHKSASRIERLRSLFNESVPSDVYHSCAYYENPEADMAKKGWLGADLVFDIDADHIPTRCDKTHDEWTCSGCGLSRRGVIPESCPSCGGMKFDAKTWPCERCIDSAKDETNKLIDLLEEDFGFSDKEIHVYFSGHRGYHVYVEDDAVKTLDTMARREIVDYVLGLGLSVLEGQEKTKDSPKKRSGPFLLYDFGWNRRLKRGMRDFIENATIGDYLEIGIKRSQSEAFVTYKKEILKRCFDEGLWNSVLGIGPESWLHLAKHIKDCNAAAVDTVVTTDIHRLIRMNGTLHGKTGLKKIEFQLRRLTEFDPFKEAIVFKNGTVEVSIFSAPVFRIGEQTFGPYKDQRVELPTAAAVLLILKNRAEVVAE